MTQTEKNEPVTMTVVVVGTSVSVLLLALLCVASTSWVLAAPEVASSDSSAGDGLDYREISLERIIDAESLRKTGSKILGWITGGAGAVDGPLVRPYGVAWDGRDLIVTDPGAGRVLRVGRRGRVVARSGREITAPIGVAVCANGIVVTEPETGRVALLDDELRFVDWIADDLERPTGVGCEANRIIVIETGRHRLLVFDAEAPGSPAVVVGGRGDGKGEFNFPTAMTVGGNSMWVGDTLNFRIQAFDRETMHHLRSFGAVGDAPGDMPRIKGLALDALGHLWISDAHLDLVAIYSAEGQFLGHIGQSGPGPAEFSFPAGIASGPDGQIAVVDSLNRRVQIFRVATSRPGGSAR